MSNEDKVSREIVPHLVVMWCYYNAVIKRSKVLLQKSLFMIFDVPVFLKTILMKNINQRKLMNIWSKNLVKDLKSKMPEFPQLDSWSGW